MKIKRFTCIRCGAPKVNSYTLPYIVCDFCGTFTDMDASIGMDVWNRDEDITKYYQKRKVEYEKQLHYALNKKKRDEYLAVQHKYWDVYYKLFPEYLPPTVHESGKYDAFLAICAESSTEMAFDPKWKSLADRQLELQQQIQYTYRGEDVKAEPEGFFALVNFYVDYVRQSFHWFYNHPTYGSMEDWLPADVNMKMKLSFFVQAWMPYLYPSDQEKLLDMLHFNNEYVDAPQFKTTKQSCQHCPAEITVPEGSFKVFCESCRKLNIIQKTFHCVSCGAEQAVPQHPDQPVNCLQCGTENRLIRPLFS